MAAEPERRYPWAPVQAEMDRQGIDQLALAEKVGYQRRTVNRWVRTGCPDNRADAVAVALGCLPWDLWPEWLEVGLADDSERRKAQRQRHAVAQREWRARNPDRAAAAQRRYRESLSPEALRAQNRKSVANRDRDRKRATDAAYRARRRAEINRRQRQWREANREVVLARAKAYYDANRDAVRARQQARRQARRAS